MIQPSPEKYVLYADDDTDDQEIVQTMMPGIDPSLEVIPVNNGLELIQYLESLPAHANMPCLILLDINMPIWDGIQTLRALKVSERYRNLPVIMFSTSNSNKDIDLALKIGARDFVTKPLHQQDLQDIVQRFADFCHNE